MFLTKLNSDEKEFFVNFIINLAKVDGKITDEERMQMIAYTNEMGITLKSLDSYSQSNEAIIKFFKENSDNQTQKAIFIESIALALVDGIDTKEEKLIKQMQNAFEFDDLYKQKVINWLNAITPLYLEGFKLIGEK